MKPRINLQNAPAAPIDATRLKQACQSVFLAAPAPAGSSLSIVITDAAALRALNQKHRQVDAPTDVLSFSAPPLPAAIAESERYLGDILIAYDYVARQAAARDINLSDALCLLVIHGSLHLLGYRHDSPAERERMWSAQAAALRRLDLDPAIVRAYSGAKD